MSYVTRADVAARAGTSVAVVSYVVNDGPRSVAAATRKRVQQAIDDLGYVPNRSARALAGSQNLSWGLLVPDISNPFFAALAHAIQDEAMTRGMTILLGDSADDKGREETLLGAFLEQRVTALIVAGVDESPHLEIATRYGVPVVMLDRVNESPGFSSVCIDNAAAARDATDVLIESGRRRIGLIGGPTGLWVSEQRVAGFRAALAARGLRENSAWELRGPFSREGGYVIGSAIAALTDRPDALFVSSDQQAIGLIAGLARHGISVPADIAIVSLDGTDEGKYTVPALTSVRQPVEEIARRTVEMLTRPGPLEPQRITIPHRLVLGGSSGSPRETAPPNPDADATATGSTPEKQQRSYS